MKKLCCLLLLIPFLGTGFCLAEYQENPKYKDRKDNLECDQNIEPTTINACKKLEQALIDIHPMYNDYQRRLEDDYNSHSDWPKIRDQKKIISDAKEAKAKAKKEEDKKTEQDKIDAAKEKITRLELPIKEILKEIEYGSDKEEGYNKPPLGLGEIFRAQEQLVADYSLTYIGFRTSYFDTRALRAHDNNLTVEGEYYQSNEDSMNLVLGGDAKLGKNILYRAIKLMSQAIGTFAVLILIVGGLMMITSQGDENRLQKGKNIVFYTLIGLVVAFVAYILVQFVISILFTAAG